MKFLYLSISSLAFEVACFSVFRYSSYTLSGDLLCFEYPFLAFTDWAFTDMIPESLILRLLLLMVTWSSWIYGSPT